MSTSSCFKRKAHARNIPYPDEVNSDFQGSLSLSYQQTHQSFDPDWKKTFHLTLSFADGAPARTHAIQAALRTYRPTYFHVWQLKTFWHESKISSDDIEVHDFEEMETTPAMEIDRTSERVQLVTKEILKFKAEYVKKLLNESNDISAFWLRKTKKPVLAVLAVKNRETDEIILYRGTNMEVSMPTGSLCAERNVIGTALATNPSLKREDLIMVAVLALSLEDTQQQLQQQQGQIEVSKQGTFVKSASTNDGNTIKRSKSVGSFVSIVEEESLSDEDEDWIQPIAESGIDSSNKNESENVEESDLSNSIIKIPQLNIEPIITCSPTNDAPARRIRIYSNADADSDAEIVSSNHVENEVEGRNSNEKQQVVHEKMTKSNSVVKREKKRTVVIHSHTVSVQNQVFILFHKNLNFFRGLTYYYVLQKIGHQSTSTLWSM